MELKDKELLSVNKQVELKEAIYNLVKVLGYSKDELLIFEIDESADLEESMWGDEFGARKYIDLGYRKLTIRYKIKP